MQSFRTELENPRVERDIVELEKKIRLFREGKIDEERFRSLRLARGVYGQRQPGVQMVRIKLPFGKVTGSQLERIAAVSDEYSTGRLHITTRQDIQIHHVSLDRTPQLWAELEKDDVTLREACGNTVRNVTASAMAGIDPMEPFDVSVYADAVYRFFLRNPVCQEMGRKFKIAFSSSSSDTALTYIHDLGFIPRLRDGKHGFKVMLGGGLGSQPREADVVYEFLEADKLIPFIEKVLRIFDRHGERSKRLKARMKFLIKDIGLEAFLQLVDEEALAVSNSTYPIDYSENESIPEPKKQAPSVRISDIEAYQAWKRTSVIEQKQPGQVAIGIKVRLGDFYTDQARALAALVRDYAADELRFTLRQDILIRHVPIEYLPFFYEELSALGLAEAGFQSTTDITACPGTDTCNLGIASSTGIAQVLEEVLTKEYPQYKYNSDITIKISGCMNACGQHNMATIGFQGMSVKAANKLVAPALQVLLGGGVLGDGKGRFADKVIKIPSKRGPQALRFILDDFETNQQPSESFLDYYDRQGQTYFYDLLKPLSDVSNLTDADFIDWGNSDNYVQEVGIGECAGVVIDLVSTLFLEAEDKLSLAGEALEEGRYADSIYHAYAAQVHTAKAWLTALGKANNTHAGIISDFTGLFAEEPLTPTIDNFEEAVYRIKTEAPSAAFALSYLAQASDIYQAVSQLRQKELQHEDSQ